MSFFLSLPGDGRPGGPVVRHAPLEQEIRGSITVFHVGVIPVTSTQAETVLLITERSRLLILKLFC